MRTGEADVLGEIVRQAIEQVLVAAGIEQRFVGEFGFLVAESRWGFGAGGRGGSGFVGDGEVEVES